MNDFAFSVWERCVNAMPRRRDLSAHSQMRAQDLSRIFAAGAYFEAAPLHTQNSGAECEGFRIPRRLRQTYPAYGFARGLKISALSNPKNTAEAMPAAARVTPPASAPRMP